MNQIRGIAVSPGTIIGVAVLVESSKPDSLSDRDRSRSVSMSEGDLEIRRYRDGVAAAGAHLLDLEKQVSARLGSDEAAIFEAQRMMLEDPVLAESVERRIRETLVRAEIAVKDAYDEQAAILQSAGDTYLAERSADLRDVGKRLVGILTGSARTIPSRLPEGCVIVADDLAPSETASLDLDRVAGLVLDAGGRTSHTAILARSLGIPAVVATGTATVTVKTGDIVAVDGTRGEVTVNPGIAELERLESDSRLFREQTKQLASVRTLPAVTADGRKVDVAANIGGIKDAYAADKCGSEGIGLFRTEFLFLDRESAPTEDEQATVYGKVLEVMSPKPVVIRTLDIGGDKEVPYLRLEREDNPFLGLRAIRLCLDRPDMFHTQLRALLRASVKGRLCIMFPMISTLQELAAAKTALDMAKCELKRQGIPVADDIQVGIMIEVPAAAINADILAPECDFFSIGTNDLVQYTLACDRNNAKVSYLSEPFDPAVLRLIERTIDEGHRHGLWVGMCGEMAGMPMAIPLLIGMGIDEISMSAGVVPAAKKLVRSSSALETSRLWDVVRTLRTSEEVKAHLKKALQIAEP